MKGFTSQTLYKISGIFFLILIKTGTIWAITTEPIEPKFTFKDFKLPEPNLFLNFLLLLILLGIIFIFLLSIMSINWFRKGEFTLKVEEAERLEGIDYELDMTERQLHLLKTLAQISHYSLREMLNNVAFEAAVDSINLLDQNKEVTVPPKSRLKKLFNIPQQEEQLVIQSQEIQEVVAEIPTLRKQLNHLFKNPRAKFVKTQMLEEGQKVIAKIPHPTKNLTFYSTVLNSSENFIWIRPPKIKNKFLNLKKIKQLDLKVVRSDNKEFKFSVKVLNQIKSPMNAVIISHTKEITKVIDRSCDRYVIEFRSYFTVVNQNAVVATTEDKEQAGYEIFGKVLDISRGGLRVQIDLEETLPQIGDMVFFKLEEAKIRQMLQAKIINIVKKPEGYQLHMQFQRQTEIIRYRLTKFFDEQQAEVI